MKKTVPLLFVIVLFVTLSGCSTQKEYVPSALQQYQDSGVIKEEMENSVYVAEILEKHDFQYFLKHFNYEKYKILDTSCYGKWNSNFIIIYTEKTTNTNVVIH